MQRLPNAGRGTARRLMGLDQAAAFIDSPFFTASSMVPTM